MRADDNSRFIHAHSHVYWDAADPRAHHIHFSDSDTMGESGKLTTRKVFAFPLPKGCYIRLVACSGGRARVGSGDEVMGLIPALLPLESSTILRFGIPQNRLARTLPEPFTDRSSRKAKPCPVVALSRLQGFFKAP